LPPNALSRRIAISGEIPERPLSTSEQHIKEGNYPLKWTRLSCMRFAANAVRLQLHALACNLVNFMGTLATPVEIERWSLTSLRERLIKTGARLVRHGRYAIFQMAEAALPREVFAGIVALITGLRGPFTRFPPSARTIRQAAQASFRLIVASVSGTIIAGTPNGKSRFRGDAAWTDSPAVACAATSELWRRDSHTGSAFVTVSTAASIMVPFFTLPRCSLGMR
jgi:hypothetical protein